MSLRNSLIFAFMGFGTLAGSVAAQDLPATVAGECRAAVKPLLLSSDTDADRVARVRAFCQALADDGDPDATYQLALFYLGLDGWDPEKASILILSAAQAGVPEAQYWLAWQYDSGPLLPDEPTLALKWYRRAADNDHPLALYRLADAHADGELGLNEDAEKARSFRARAARCANPPG
jgi:TPR repeat protein